MKEGPIKIRNFFELLGFKSKPKRYGYTVDEINAGSLGLVRYAQWQHPAEYKKSITPEEVASYKSIINEGDFCIDIGAHTGDTTLQIAFAAGKSGLTLALEPNPFVFPVLEKNARANRDKVTILPVLAAAGSDGEMVFDYTDSGYYNGGKHEGISMLRHGRAYKLSVQGIDLSKELRTDFSEELRRLKFIKIDAEGYDLSVVQSLREIIEEFRPYLRVEIFKKTSTAYREELLQFFFDRNYTLYKLEKDPFTPGQKMGLEDVGKWKNYDVLCFPKNQSGAR